ncbi:Carboxylic ester hydrolase [Mycena sanguinolenta]|uniref:Carboxylic ester hydrolase n=1 Tax=Mycena sanguinolenta TaxID=230812 RepID=A0A8H6ZKT1_9AGAR|nr:Carboxylic ester hydrolase [Mycena sanguinolenta]
MISPTILCIYALFGVSLSTVAASTASGPTISLDYGTFLGVNDGNLTKFLGVPFSAPTARFELPRAPSLLDGIQNATVFGPACVQQAFSNTLPFTFQGPTVTSEDCLNLDVFSPAAHDAHSKFPVLVFLFGGGFDAGSSAATDFRPVVERSILIGEAVVIVAPNYRVSAFGFLAGKEVAEAGLTNLGLRDQIAALEWVQKYISAFGGDPSRVVLGGLSAGAFSTGVHLVSNNGPSSDLFRGAFMVSGSPIASPTVADGQSTYDQLVAANNCTNARDTLDCLRQAPLDDFLLTVNQTSDVFGYRALSAAWRPRVDCDLIPRNPVDMVQDGAYLKVPVMIGNPDDEGTLFAYPSVNVTTDSEFVGYVHSNYLPTGSPAQISRVAELYPQDPSQGAPFNTGSANQLTPEFKRIAAFGGDLYLTGLRRFFVQRASKTQNTWSWLSKRGKWTPYLGAYHTSDMALWFPANATDAEEESVAVDALINFINTLDPNVSAVPRASNLAIFWPKYQANSTGLLTFSDPAVTNVTADDFRVEEMQYLINLHLDGVTAKGF